MTKPKTSKVIGIIPARYESVRFPGKILVDILGKSLIRRTYENTIRCPFLDEVIVATDDPRIYDHVIQFAKVVMTPKDCATGTDRIAYVVKNEKRYQDAEIIINVQGDEPCLDTSVTAGIVKALQNDPKAPMATAITKFKSEEEAVNPNDVKCVIDLNGYALYFSRTLIPTGKYRQEITYYKHIGVYAFRPDFLLKYAQMPQTPLQKAEELEQLRVLEHGYKIKTVIVNGNNPGVNSPEDIKKVELEICKQNSFS